MPGLRLPIRSLLLIVGLYLAFATPLLSASGVGGSSEARELEVAQTVLAQGELLLPKRNGVVPSKPPLYHWTTALLSAPFGEVSTLLGRFTSLLAGAVMLWLTGTLAWYIALALRGAHERVAAYGAVMTVLAVLTLSYGFVNEVSSATVDAVFVMWVVVAIVALLLPLPLSMLGVRDLAVPYRERDWHLFYFAASIAMLAKGPLGLALSLAVTGVVASVRWGPRRALQLYLKPRSAWIWPLLVTLPWYLAAARYGGDEFIDRQLLFENLERLFGGEGTNVEVWWFYLPSFLRSGLPWSVLFLVLLWRVCRSLRRNPTRFDAARGAIDLMGACWVGVVLLLFTLAAGKRHSYLLPLYPGLALFVGIELWRYWYSAAARTRAVLLRVASVVVTSASLLLLIGAAAIVVAPFWIGNGDEVSALFSMYLRQGGVMVAAVWAAAAVLVLYLRDRAVLSATWLVSAAVLWGAMAFGLGLKYHLKGFDQMVRQVAPHLTPGVALPVVRQEVDELFDPLLWYLKQPARFVSLAKGELPPLALCDSAPLLTRHTLYQQWQRRIPERFQVIEKVNQRYDALRGRTDRAVVLLRCRAREEE